MVYIQNQTIMYKEVLRSMAGVEIFPVIGLVIFFCFFAAWLWHVMSFKKEFVEQMSQMPLEETTETKRASQEK